MSATSATATIASPTIAPLDPGLDEEAAAMLVEIVPGRTIERAREEIAAARSEDDQQILGLREGERLAAIYILRKHGLANEISYLVVAPAERRKGHGRMCLYDALLRSGRRPLVLQTLESELPFYKKVGFKIVARRKDDEGRVVYRLGWHAPMPTADGKGTVVC